MLDRGIRHLPVVSATGRVLGVVEDADLAAAEARTPFHLRAAIARAPTVDALAQARRELRPTIVALHRARADPLRIAAVHSVVVDALTRRLIDLAVAEVGPARASRSPGWRWAAWRGARRLPGSDVESAIAWQGDAEGDGLVEHALAISRRVEAGLCALRPAPRRARHDRGQPAARPLAGLLAARGAQLAGGPDPRAGADPRLRDGRQPHGVGAAHRACPSPRRFRRRARPPGAVAPAGALLALHRPPTGFLRGLVVEHSGEHRGRLDLKHGGSFRSSTSRAGRGWPPG